MSRINVLRQRRQEAKRAAKRKQILACANEIYERYGFRASFARDDIAQKVGRILLTHYEAEAELKQYRLLWRYQEWPDIDSLDPICYGDHWKQRWWLLRDLVPPTRRVRSEARKLRRLGQRCIICGARYPYRRLSFDFIEGPRDFWRRECGAILIPRHYAIPYWERTSHKLHRDPSFAYDWERYMSVIKHQYGESCPPLSGQGLLGYVCSARCEATRFSRWRGMEDFLGRLYRKERNREKKESQWINQGREMLKQAQRYLNQRACK